MRLELGTMAVLPQRQHEQTRIEILGSDFVTSEAIEDDLVCGIEIALSTDKSDASTLPTDPMTAGSLSSSESWSVSNNSLVEVSSDTCDSADFDCDEMDPPMLSRRQPVQRSFFCNPQRSLESYTDAVCSSPVYGRHVVVEKRVPSLRRLPRRVVPCDVQEESTRVEMVLVVKFPEAELEPEPEATVAATEQDHSIINVIEPKPERLFKSLMGPKISWICKLSVQTQDMPFMLKSVRHRNSKRLALQPPFVMFPNKASVFVAKHPNSNIYQMLTQDQIPTDAVSELFKVQNRMDGRFVSLTAFCGGIPSLEGRKPLALQDSNFSILLDDWRRKQTRTSPKGSKRTRPPSRQTKEMQIHVDDENQHFICNPSSLPLMTSPKSQNDDETSMFNDDELRAVMKLTKNGNDTTAVFPSFSEICSSFDSFAAESNDGLDDEWEALDILQKELRVELQTAEVIIRGTGEKDMREAMEAIRNMPLSMSPTSPETMPGKHIRRVRFSNYNEERTFISELESKSEESRDDAYGFEFFLDELTYSLEEMVEDVFSNVLRKLERGRTRQPRQHGGTGRTYASNF